MTVVLTETWVEDYRKLNFAAKIRVKEALRRLEADDPSLRLVEIDPSQGVQAAFVDEFLAITFRTASLHGSVYLLNVRSTDVAKGT